MVALCCERSVLCERFAKVFVRALWSITGVCSIKLVATECALMGFPRWKWSAVVANV